MMRVVIRTSLQVWLPWVAFRRFSRQASAHAILRCIATRNWPAQDQCPFAALGLDRGVSAEELHARYLQLAKRLHPDAAGSEAAATTRAFVDLKRTYEAAVQLRQRGANTSKTQTQVDNGCPNVWMSEEAWTHEQVSAATKSKRREWNDGQEVRRAFWAAQEAHRPLGQHDITYTSAIADLFESRLEAETANQQRDSIMGSVCSARGEPADEHATPGIFSASQWERDLEAELRDFGLDDQSRSEYITLFASFRGGGRPKTKTWIRRTENRSLGAASCLVALAAGVTLIALVAPTLVPLKGVE